jgi:hypothetical protein
MMEGKKECTSFKLNVCMNKKFWEELITCFPFTATSVSDMASRKKSLMCMHNEVNKQYRFGGCSVDITNGSDL